MQLLIKFNQYEKILASHSICDDFPKLIKDNYDRSSNFFTQEQFMVLSNAHKIILHNPNSNDKKIVDSGMINLLIISFKPFEALYMVPFGKIIKIIDEKSIIIDACDTFNINSNDFIETYCINESLKIYYNINKYSVNNIYFDNQIVNKIYKNNYYKLILQESFTFNNTIEFVYLIRNIN